MSYLRNTQLHAIIPLLAWDIVLCWTDKLPSLNTKTLLVEKIFSAKGRGKASTILLIKYWGGKKNRFTCCVGLHYLVIKMNYVYWGEAGCWDVMTG